MSTTIMWVLHDVQHCPRIISMVLMINESWGQPKLVLLIQYFERPPVLAIVVLVLRIGLACLNTPQRGGYLPTWSRPGQYLDLGQLPLARSWLQTPCSCTLVEEDKGPTCWPLIGHSSCTPVYTMKDPHIKGMIDSRHCPIYDRPCIYRPSCICRSTSPLWP
jgi:hypothetical protein